jgi:hypothetical protein
MGANLAVNNAAILPDRRHPNAQCLTDGSATFARTNQSDQGNFPVSESVFSCERTNTTATRTRGHLRRVRSHGDPVQTPGK